MMNAASAANAMPPSPGARAGGRPVGAALAILATAAMAAACGTGGAAIRPGPQPPAPRLPPIPAVDGPLDLRVSYPRDSLELGTRGRNFIFGSAGSGEARVWVNGREVDVEPNGGFLAFLPVPGDSLYRVRATLRGESQTVDVPVLLPPSLPEPGDGAVIVEHTVRPWGAWVAQPGERIEVGFTGTAGGDAWLLLGSEVVPLVPVTDRSGGVTDFEVMPTDTAAAGDGAAGPAARAAFTPYRGFFTARRIVSADTAVPWPVLTDEIRPAAASSAPPDTGAADEVGKANEADEGDALDAFDASSAVLVLAADGDTARMALPVNLLLADPHRPRVGVGLDLDPPNRNGDGAVVARPGPGGGPYHYTWANGVELELTGERNGAYRVRLTGDLSAWTPAGDVQLRVPGTPPPTSRVAVVRLDPQPEYVDIRIPLSRRLPYQVEEDERSVSVVVYGALSRANFLQHGRVDPYIDRAEWRQPSDREFRLDVHLTGLPWGYDTFWSPGGDLVVRLKRPPALDPDRPLRGLTVGVDAGHGGTDTLTMGPTGLTEADANLGVTRALRAELERRGARVVVSRGSNTTASLVERTELARAEDVDVWISVHNNAFPDGVEPRANAGTSVYYNHPRAAGLAWSVHRALLEELGLRDLGVGRADLHQARFTWAPAVLTESMFMMIPEHEAFLKTEDGRRRLARAHVRGLEAWLRQVAGRVPPP